ncbi:MAG TPA: hypothetical protein VKT32_06955 [Chthonomonadaceae bacterium]|nr:hypothetical protein [Chthonomonadaceae bacterium]
MRRYPVACSVTPPDPICGKARADLAAPEHFGPRSLPLFYTALERPPERLAWEPGTHGRASRILLGACEGDGEIRPMIATDLPAGSAPSWSLPGLALMPGLLYAWRIEAEREEGSDAGPPSLPCLEGRFWLLDAGKAARLAQGRQILAQSTEPEFAPIAQALMLAELGLYQEALRHIQKDSGRRVRPAHALVGHVTQALIYRQMVQLLEREARPVPPAFALWARNREAFHRKQAEARSASGPGDSPSGAAFLDML